MLSLSVPLPFATAILATAGAARVALGDDLPPRARGWFVGLFSVGALLAVLVGLRFGYGWEALAPLQRVLPGTLGPIAYLGFRELRLHDTGWRWRSVLHAWPLITATTPWLLPLSYWTADVVIGASYAIYGGLLLALYLRGPAAFEHLRLASLERARMWLLVTVAFLMLLLCFDTWIAFRMVAGPVAAVPAILAMGHLAMMGILLALIALVPRVMRRLPPTSATDDDTVVLAALTRLLETERCYTDPGLTLSRLARRLGMPARRVSEAINRQQRMNISQFLNAFRIAHASERLRQSDETVTEIMLGAGFSTKSNFNREFKRLTGYSPTQYRANARLSPSPDSESAHAGSRAGPPRCRQSQLQNP